MLAEATCKHDAPTDVYWQQGRSTERDFICTTTQTFSRAMLARLSEEVDPERSLLILCKAFTTSAEPFPNLTVKKIPKAVLSRWRRAKSTNTGPTLFDKDGEEG